MGTAVGLLGPAGYTRIATWTTPALARARSIELLAGHRGDQTEVVRNPHLTEEWAASAVRSPRLLAAVTVLLGPDVAVENTFLVIKWPGAAFEVPWHQDGINDRLELAPGRSIAAWLALTDALPGMGCLHVAPGSQELGYLPYDVEQGSGAARGRALGAQLPDGAKTNPVPVPAGAGVLMDTRLLHCSGSNESERTRIGLNVRYVAPDGCTRRDPTSPSLVPVSGSGW